MLGNVCQSLNLRIVDHAHQRAKQHVKEPIEHRVCLLFLAQHSTAAAAERTLGRHRPLPCAGRAPTWHNSVGAPTADKLAGPASALTRDEPFRRYKWR